MARFTLCFLLFLLLPGVAFAASSSAETVADLLQGADSYSYTLSAGPDSVKVKTVSGETFGTVLEGEGGNGGLKKDAKGNWIADPHLSTRIAPFVVQRAFTAKQGDVALDVQVEGKKHKLYAAGTAEAVYALRLLAPPQMFDKWLDAHAPLGDSFEALGNLPARTKDAKADGLLDAAKEAYAEKRPALMRKYGRSYLYYGPAKDMSWSVKQSKDGKTFYAVASAADLMYMAQFWFRFTKGVDGMWQNDKVFGEETFKGE